TESAASSKSGPLAAFESPFSQLLNLLSQPFVTKSLSLTDRLLRLLSSAMINTNLVDPDEPLSENRVPASSLKYTSLENALSNGNQLQLLVTFYTSTTGSDNGLNDAHSLMVKLSSLFPNCREIFQQKLLDSA